MTDTKIDISTLPSLRFSERHALPRCPAIYFVLSGSEVVYIGRASCLASRWRQHHITEKFEDDSDVFISWVESDPATSSATEAEFINQFKPRLNLRVKHDGGLQLVAGFVPPEVKSLVRKIAEREDRSESQVVRILLEESPRIKAKLRRDT